MSRSKNNNGNRATRISQIQMDTEELTEEMERKFLTILHKNVIPILNEEESDALK
jgi:hypothetical protein